ncbi:MAG TPA: ABC transporter permease [Terriglobales bacterium]|nr:ABC transporter permease [Terriglobales bacterium]
MPDFQQMVRERLRDCGLAPTREWEIVDELAQHLRDRYESQLSSGMNEEEAGRAVVAELDGRDLAGELRELEERSRDPVGLESGEVGRFWPDLWQDLRYAARTLRLDPGFTRVCVLSLALGIGANTAIFQLIDAVRMRTLPVKHPEELALIRPTNFQTTGRKSGRYGYVTNPMWEQIRARQEGFSGVFAFGDQDFNLATGGQVRNAQGLWVSGEFFDVLGIQPVLGRVFHASEDHAGCGAPGAVISYGFWQSEFGGEASAIGKTVALEGHPFPVLGVTPASFHGADVGHSFDVAVLICSEPVIAAENSIYAWRHAWWLAVMGRLEPGWTLEKASAQLETISGGIMQETLPPVYQAEARTAYLGKKLNAFPASTGVSNLRREYESPLWLLLAITGLVLLIACANLANLMLARAMAREREIAVRIALGAARGRIVRQLFTESLLVALLGATLGIVVARTLSSFLVRYLSGEGDVRHIFVGLVMDWRVLGFTAGLAVVTCLLVGLAPAITITGAAPARVMSLAGRGLTATRERFSLRRGLVVAQVALSLVLVVSALLFGGSLRKILTLDAGFQRDGVLVMDIDFTRLEIPKQQWNQFRENIVERVRALPGVESAAESEEVPLGGSYWNDQVVVNGEVNKLWVDMGNITPGYFKTIGTPLLAGRDFNQRDTSTSPKVAIVNQEFARKILRTENPIGRTFKINVYRGQPQHEYEIVGVMGNAKYDDLRKQFEPVAFYPQMQDDRPDENGEIIVRSSGTLEPIVGELRRAMAEVNPAIAIDFHSLSQQIKDGLLRERLLAMLSGLFGLLAAVLATVGLYGVMAYMVARRTNEIGIRMALGAAPRRMLAMVLGEAGQLLGVGITVGVVAVLAVGRWAASLLFGLKPYDPAVLMIACLGLAVVAVVASTVPARRAAKLQPMVALRHE